MLILQYYLL